MSRGQAIFPTSFTTRAISGKAAVIFANTFVTLPVLHRISPCTEYSPPMSQSPDADHTIPVYGVPICIPARSVPASDEASPDRACASAPNSELAFPD